MLSFRYATITCFLPAVAAQCFAAIADAFRSILLRLLFMAYAAAITTLRCCHFLRCRHHFTTAHAAIPCHATLPSYCFCAMPMPPCCCRRRRFFHYALLRLPLFIRFATYASCILLRRFFRAIAFRHGYAARCRYAFRLAIITLFFAFSLSLFSPLHSLRFATAIHVTPALRCCFSLAALLFRRFFARLPYFFTLLPLHVDYFSLRHYLRCSSSPRTLILPILRFAAMLRFYFRHFAVFAAAGYADAVSTLFAALRCFFLLPDAIIIAADFRFAAFRCFLLFRFRRAALITLFVFIFRLHAPMIFRLRFDLMLPDAYLPRRCHADIAIISLRQRCR